MISGDCNVCINGKLPSYSATCVECGLSRKNYKPITNGDRIRRMSDEDLAAEMKEEGGCPHDCECPDVMDTDCYKCWLDWIRQEAQPC